MKFPSPELCCCAVVLGKQRFLLVVPELGCVPGGHRNLHSGPCSVGHEGEPGNDSCVETFHRCEKVHVNTRAGRHTKILCSQRQRKRDKREEQHVAYKTALVTTQGRQYYKKKTNPKQTWPLDVKLSQVTVSIG